MANQLDLEEQEQLDQIKHFWKQHGNLITWILIAVLAAFAGWNAYQLWQRNQSEQASAMYDELDRQSRQADLALVERAFADMKDRYPRTTYAWQGALLAAKVLSEGGKTDSANAALTWILGSSADDGYKAIARLRLAGLLAEGKFFDQALAQLGGDFPAQFQGLAADRRGDVLQLQGKTSEARAAFGQAYKLLDERVEYRRLVELKLNALGVDPRAATADGAATLAAAGGASASGATK